MMTFRAATLKLAVAACLVVGTACATSAQPTKQPNQSEVVATLGDTKITLAEVDERALQQPASAFGSAKLVQALYVARRASIDSIIADRLMDQEAKARGIDRATLVEREVAAKAPVPTEAEISDWYKANQARVNGASLDQVKAPIRSLLTEERMEAARTALVDSLKAKATISVSLEPPRITVASDGRPALGKTAAAVEIIEFSDFQCPFCQRAYPTVEQVLKTYGDKIHFVYRHYPLGNHPDARPAAEASACAESQGKFWEYHDRLFGISGKLSAADLKAHAAALGLDIATFSACVDNRQTKARVDEDMKAADAAGVTGTPAFFINGRSLEGAQPFEAFKRVIDEELARAK